MIGRLVAGKFRNPSGFLGRLVGQAMARNNEPAVNWTISLLDIQPEDHILEIGFGPGVGIEYISHKAINGFVAGIDASKTMVQVARRHNGRAIQAGRVNLQQGEVSALPYKDESFDKAVTIHCIYFWKNPTADLQEIYRTLKQNGRLAITILPKDTWLKQKKPPVPPPDLFTLYNSDEVAQLFSNTGFHKVQIENCPPNINFSGACVIGFK
jgi:ubiquinone/menaquinone biosynthesis C-methylase UbiE